MWVIDFFYFLKEWWFIISMVIVGIASFKKGIDSINSNLKDVVHEISKFNEKIKLSEKDRERIHVELETHRERLDNHELKFASYNEKIAILFKENEKK
jgi:hypothetical protein